MGESSARGAVGTTLGTLPVRFTANTWDQLTELCESHLNGGQACLAVAERPAPGTRVEVTLVAPNGHQAVVRGRVRELLPLRVRDETILDLGHSNYGVGDGGSRRNRGKARIRIQFSALSESERRAIGALMLERPKFLAIGTRPDLEPELVVQGRHGRQQSKAELADKLDSLQGLAAHEVLEVGASAGLDEVQHAYVNLKAEWAPGKFLFAPMVERELVAEIVLIVQRSYYAMRRIIDADVADQRSLPAPQLRSPRRSEFSKGPPPALALAYARHALESGELDRADALFNYVLDRDPKCVQAAQGIEKVGHQRAAAVCGPMHVILRRRSA